MVLPRFVLLDQGSGLQRLFSRYLDDIEILKVQDLDQALGTDHPFPLPGVDYQRRDDWV